MELSGNYGGSGSSASDTVAQMRRPTLIKREFKLDPEEEERQIQEILGDDSDEFEEETIKTSTMPVMLTDREFLVLKVVCFLIIFFILILFVPKSQLYFL